MTDLLPTITPNSDQLNADNLLAGPRTIVVRDVQGRDDPQQPINIFFDGDDGKPYRPCKSMRRVLVKVWGKDGKSYIGRSMTLYCDPTVTFGKIAVGGIRISHMSGLDQDMTVAMTVSKSVRRPFTVKPLIVQAQPPAPSPEAVDDAMRMARNAASCGTEAFTRWYNSDDGKALRDLFRRDAEFMGELKSACAEADQSIQV